MTDHEVTLIAAFHRGMDDWAATYPCPFATGSEEAAEWHKGRAFGALAQREIQGVATDRDRRRMEELSA